MTRFSNLWNCGVTLFLSSINQGLICVRSYKSYDKNICFHNDLVDFGTSKLLFALSPGARINVEFVFLCVLCFLRFSHDSPGLDQQAESWLEGFQSKCH